MEKTITLTITPTWAIVEHVRKKINTQLGDFLDSDVIDGAMICASELCENAIKYGEPVPNMQFIQFQLNYSDGKIEIEISNGVVNQVDLDNVCSSIDKTNGTNNPEKLYLERLQELMDMSKPQKSQLGLYRIVCETGFKLQYKLEGNALTISADLELN